MSGGVVPASVTAPFVPVTPYVGSTWPAVAAMLALVRMNAMGPPPLSSTQAAVSTPSPSPCAAFRSVLVANSVMTLAVPELHGPMMSGVIDAGETTLRPKSRTLSVALGMAAMSVALQLHGGRQRRPVRHRHLGLL